MVPVDCLAHFWDFGGLVQVKITTTDNQVSHSTTATTRGGSLDDLMLEILNSGLLADLKVMPFVGVDGR